MAAGQWKASFAEKQLTRSLPVDGECAECLRIPQEGLPPGQPQQTGGLSQTEEVLGCCRSKTSMDTHQPHGLLGKCLFSTSFDYFTCKEDLNAEASCPGEALEGLSSGA